MTHGIEDVAAAADGFCERLERGEILVFEDTWFLVEQADRGLLTGVAASSLTGKNISYSRESGTLRVMRGRLQERVREAMRRYSDRAVEFCGRVLAPFARSWRVELCSFRPVEERGRDLPARERNDLLHVDAYPNRPTRGARILRFFTNIHPSHDRVWITSDPLHRLARDQRWHGLILENPPRRRFRSPSWALRIARIAGLSLPDRSCFDVAMLRMHDRFKRSRQFQAECPKHRHRFPPGASWMVFTDAVPHAVVEGQYALEQSFFVPRDALLRPELSPVALLDSLIGPGIGG